MYEIKHLDVWVATRYATLLGFLTSLVGSALLLVIYVIMELRLFSGRYYSYNRIDFEELIPFFIAPLLITLLTLIATAVFCVLYNLIAERTQGVQVELEFVPEDDSKTKPV